MKVIRSRIKFIFVFITSVCMGLILQGCNASLAKASPNSAFQTIDKKTAQELYEGGAHVYLDSIIPGGMMGFFNKKKYLEKPMIISRGPNLQKLIMQGERGKKVKDCQFIAARVELDGKPQTADFIITTQGKGHCGTEDRNFWIVQKSKNQPAKIELEGLAYKVDVRRPDAKDTLWNIIVVRTSDRINKMLLDCDSEYAKKNGRYQLLSEYVTANKPTGRILPPNIPEMYWEDVTGEYHCRK